MNEPERNSRKTRKISKEKNRSRSRSRSNKNITKPISINEKNRTRKNKDSKPWSSKEKINENSKAQKIWKTNIIHYPSNNSKYQQHVNIYIYSYLI